MPLNALRLLHRQAEPYDEHAHLTWRFSSLREERETPHTCLTVRIRMLSMATSHDRIRVILHPPRVEVQVKVRTNRSRTGRVAFQPLRSGVERCRSTIYAPVVLAREIVPRKTVTRSADWLEHKFETQVTRNLYCDSWCAE